MALSPLLLEEGKFLAPPLGPSAIACLPARHRCYAAAGAILISFGGGVSAERRTGCALMSQ